MAGWHRLKQPGKRTVFQPSVNRQWLVGTGSNSLGSEPCSSAHNNSHKPLFEKFPI